MSREQLRFPTQPEDIRRTAASSRRIRALAQHFGAERQRQQRERQVIAARSRGSAHRRIP